MLSCIVMVNEKLLQLSYKVTCFLYSVVVFFVRDYSTDTPVDTQVLEKGGKRCVLTSLYLRQHD